MVTGMQKCDIATCKLKIFFSTVIAFSFTSSVFDVKENEKAAVEIQLASGELSEPVTIE